MKANKIIKGLIFLLIGTILLANTLEILDWSVWPNLFKLWPLLIISLGLSLIFRGKSLSFCFHIPPLLLTTIHYSLTTNLLFSKLGFSFKSDFI